MYEADDETDRNTAEQTLRDKGASVWHMPEIAGLGMFDRDLATGHLRWSDEVFRILGTPVDEKPGFESLIAIIHPDDRERVIAELARADVDKNPHRHEFRIRHLDGGIRHIYTMGEYLNGTNSTAAKHVGVIQDITDLKGAEEILKQNETRFRQAQTLAHLGWFERDLATNALLWSNETRRIFGVSSDEIISSKSFHGAIHPEDLEGVRKSVERLFATQQPIEDEFRILRPDGSIRYVHRILEFMTDAEGVGLVWKI